MTDKKLRQILALVQTLTVRQRKALALHLADMDQTPEAIKVIEQRSATEPVCPRCGQSHIARVRQLNA